LLGWVVGLGCWVGLGCCGFGNLIFYFLFVFGCVVLRGLGGVWMCCFAGVGWRLHGFNKMCIIWVAPPWGLIWLFGSPGV
jgi:hypothetical protein